MVVSFLLLAVAPVNHDPDTLVALHGYDAVAYFTEGKPVPGETKHVLRWNGALWRFATAANLALFKAEPEKYAPQYGGYCAYGIAGGYAVNGDPHAWKIVDGKLYLNYNARVQKEWQKDVPGYITKADANWPGLLAD